jgi:hypothetical protein
MVTFEPRFQLIPEIQRRIKAIVQATGFLRAVRLRPECIARVRKESQVQEALASAQMEKRSLTLQEAFDLAHEVPDRELRPDLVPMNRSDSNPRGSE